MGACFALCNYGGWVMVDRRCDVAGPFVGGQVDA